MTEHSYGESFKFFADRQQDPMRQVALNVQQTVTRGGYPTLSIEGAQMLNSKADWVNKITLQLTRNELTAFCSVLFGLKPALEVKYHGEARNKGLNVYDNRDKGAALILSEKGRQIQCFLPADDRLELAAFGVCRLSQAWSMAPADAIAVLRQGALLGRKVSDTR